MFDQKYFWRAACHSPLLKPRICQRNGSGFGGDVVYPETIETVLSRVNLSSCARRTLTGKPAETGALPLGSRVNDWYHGTDQCTGLCDRPSSARRSGDLLEAGCLARRDDDSDACTSFRAMARRQDKSGWWIPSKVAPKPRFPSDAHRSSLAHSRAFSLCAFSRRGSVLSYFAAYWNFSDDRVVFLPGSVSLRLEAAISQLCVASPIMPGFVQLDRLTSSKPSVVKSRKTGTSSMMDYFTT